MARAADLDLTSDRVRRTVTAMRDRHVALDTTAVILERLMLSRAGTTPSDAADYLSHMPIGYQRYRRRSFVPLKDAAEDRRYQAGFAKLLDVIRLLDESGIHLLPGTDDGVGFSARRELDLYVMAGIAPARALRLATLGAAEYLGQAHQRGSIERGKLAEFLLIAGDPTKDIAAIRRPRMVMRVGAIYYPSENPSKAQHRAIGPPPKATMPTIFREHPMLRQVLAFSLLMVTAISTEAAAQNPRFYTRSQSKMPFSAVVRAGDYLHISGQIGVADDGTVPPAMADQARLAMEHIRDALALAGGTLDDVVKCTVMLDDMSKWHEFNTVYVGFFKAGRLPARSAFGTAGLAFGAGVEVECLAYRPVGSK